MANGKRLFVCNCRVSIEFVFYLNLNSLLKIEATHGIARIIKSGCNSIDRKRLASTKILYPCTSRSRTEQILIYSQTTLKLRIPSLVKYRN